MQKYPFRLSVSASPQIWRPRCGRTHHACKAGPGHDFLLQFYDSVVMVTNEWCNGDWSVCNTLNRSCVREAKQLLLILIIFIDNLYFTTYSSILLRDAHVSLAANSSTILLRCYSFFAVQKRLYTCTVDVPQRSSSSCSGGNYF